MLARLLNHGVWLWHLSGVCTCWQ